jgi:hemerythrin
MQLNTPFQEIEWKDTMSTGVGAIDKQHQYLVDTLQQANQKLLKAPKDDVLLENIVRALLGYAITHFDTEETLMQRYGYQHEYPETAQKHIDEHREFSRKMVAVVDQLREGRAVSRVELLAYLNNWLRDHVLTVDALLGKFLREKKAEKS